MKFLDNSASPLGYRAPAAPFRRAWLRAIKKAAGKPAARVPQGGVNEDRMKSSGGQTMLNR
jgi:hypothetical protein